METLQISLAAARVNKGLTQEEVAKKIKKSKNTIVNWEKGKVNPPFESVQELAELYGISANNIFLPKKST